MTDRFIIIGRLTCPFCVKAIDYCRAKGVQYFFLNYTKNPSALEEYKQFHDQPTVPIILANSSDTGYTKKVGGYSDLLEYL
jgi:glutaredoxin